MPNLLVRVYLDANVLFSASYDPISDFLRFWRLNQVQPVTSSYAIGEVTRNIRKPGHAERLNALLARTMIVSDSELQVIPPDVLLVEKDRPILAAAIAAGVEYLATGDWNHFEGLYGRQIAGVTVLLPKEFLDRHQVRFKE